MATQFQAVGSLDIPRCESDCLLLEWLASAVFRLD